MIHISVLGGGGGGVVVGQQGTVCCIHCMHLHTAQNKQTRKRDLKSCIQLYFGSV